MQAIILAAGMGKRLGEYTHEKAKCMVSVAGVPMIDRMLAQLAALKTERVVIVTGYMAGELEKHIGNRYEGMLKIEYVENPDYATTNNIYSLYLARDTFSADDTLLLESDLVIDDSLLPALVGNACRDVALVSKFQSWMNGTVVTLGGGEKIVRFIGKEGFREEDSGGYYKTVNIYKFSRDFLCKVYLPALEKYRSEHGDNEYYEKVLGEIVERNEAELFAQVADDKLWYEIDDSDDLAAAERRFGKD